MMSTPDIGSNTEPDNTSNGTSNSQTPGDTIKPNRNLLLAIASGLSLFLLLASWAWIVPPKSAPDDDYHLTTIWCAWGDSEYCIVESPTSVRVPDQLIGLNCRNFDFTMPDAQCTWTAPFKFTSTDRFRSSSGYNSPLFYQVNGLFVNDDIAVSTLRMRLFSSALMSVLFGLAVYLSRSEIRRGLSLTWMVAATPLVAFSVASTTPQSWAIIGVSLSWVFFASWLMSKPGQKLDKYLALGGTIVSLLVGASARSDAAIYLAVSYAAVVAIYWKQRRRFQRRLFAFLIPAALVLAVAASYRITGLGGGTTSAISRGVDGIQWNLLVPMLADFPAFLAGVTGFFPASQVPWNGLVSWGLGWEGFPSPSLAYLPLLLAIGGLSLWGMRAMPGQRKISLAFITLPIMTIPFITVWSSNFTSGVQLRYFVPLLLVFLSFIYMGPLSRVHALSRGQLWSLGILVFIGGSVASISAMVRYRSGLTELWDIAWARFWVDSDNGDVFTSALITSVSGGVALALFVCSMCLLTSTSQKELEVD